MRCIALALSLLALDAFGYVDIVAPRIETGAPQRILEKCDGLSSTGCTRFVEVRMLCECLEVPDGWKLQASVRAVPQIFITSVSWLGHEKGHVWDFKSYITAHVKALGSRRFPTRRTCETLLVAASDAFPETMQRIARLSAARRDGKAARSEDHLVVVQAKIMPELVDDRLAHLADNLPSASRDAKDRAAKDGDLIGERGKHVVAALREGDASVDAKQLVVRRSFAKDVAVFFTRLFFDHDDHVVEQPGELVRQLFESLFDELVEFRPA